MEKTAETDEAMRQTDELFMRRCLQLAENGRENVAPNPMVGAVIVWHGKIIGEGYHAHFGEGHAEVNAIASVKDPSLLPESTIYVSLEPCAHYGKTPPCADLIVSKGFKRVVVGCGDPFAKVAGRGIQKIRAAGIPVTVGVLEKECRALNCRFMTFQQEKRPYLTLKWAESRDGFIDGCRTAQESPVRLSSPLTQMRVHKLRAENQAILVGKRTALLDNPSLTVREWAGRNPVRVVLDADLTLPHSLKLFDGTVPTLVVADTGAEEKTAVPGVEILRLPLRTQGLPVLLAALYQRNLQSLLVEGGACTLSQFIEQGCWDECWREVSPLALGKGVKAPVLNGADLRGVETWDGHQLLHYHHFLPIN